MLMELLRMERRLLLRNGVFWIVALVFGAMGFAMLASDNVTYGGGVGNVMRNAPAITVVVLASISVISVLLTTIFVGGIALRDFEQRTAELFFTTPMAKGTYLAGRFGGGFLASLGVMLAVVLGMWLGSLMPWLDKARLGPTPWAAYAWGLGVLVLPNLLFLSALLFALASATRSMLYTYVGVIAFFVLTSVSGSLTSDLQTRWIGALLDPSGGDAVSQHIRYWSSAQLNTQLPALTGLLLANRAIWLGAAVLLLWLAYALFRADREGLKLPWKRRKATAATASLPQAPAPMALPQASLRNDAGARWRQFLQVFGFDLRHALRGAPLLVILLLALVVLYFVFRSGGMMYGTSVYPVTGQMQSFVSGGLSLFLIIVLTFYAGELVWRDRGTGVASVADAYPTPDWIPLAAKLTALAGIVVVFHLVGMVFAMGYQLFHGYTRLQPLLYLQGMALDVLPFLLTSALAVFLQVLSGNKFIGYLLMIVYLVGRAGLGMLHFDHALYNFGKASPTPYSDMNGWGHFIAPDLWFRTYWAALCVALLALAAALWPRGASLHWRDRLRQLRARLRGPLLGTAVAGLLAFVALGGWIFYNTNVLNRYVSQDQAKHESADYEKAYRQYKDLPQPTVEAVTTEVEIHPKTRSVHIRGQYLMRNATSQPVTQLHVTIDPDTVARLDFPAHTLVKQDKVSGYTIYALATPLAPGAQMRFGFDLSSAPHGFPLNGGDTAVVYNGTFFNNFAALPQLGYDPNRQLQDRNDRRKYGLPELPRMNPIGDTAAYADNYLGHNLGWVDFDTTVSTDQGQIALAPGYLQKEWTDNGHHYYHYKSEAKLLNFFSWLSADWQVKRDRWNDVAIEIYYDRQHPYNVARMDDAAKKALSYYSSNFSPYQFRQVRILEFPGYQTFAQAFAGTIPFSEGIGFIARVDGPDDIDYPFYVTAHEVAHQWWAHQVIGANVQGATMLSESLAQYSALMVMEHEYGPQKMRRFLKYELDSYLRSRAGERVAEQPLALNENQQYIHYRKGSVVFYALKDAIGEDTLNHILSQFVARYAFKGAPYPTTRNFLDMLYAGTDPKYHDFIRDLFERIVFWENRTTEATAVKRADGKYEVTLKLHASMQQADGKGKVTDLPVDEWVDVGVFARPDGGKEDQEKVLYLQKQHITSADTTLKIVVDAKPFDAGIDPYNKLVDTDSDDNRKQVVLK